MDVFICDKVTLAVLDTFLAPFYVLRKLKYNFRFIATVLIWHSALLVSQFDFCR